MKTDLKRRPTPAELQDILNGTDLDDADFEDARLSGADLSGAINLTQDQLDKACGDANTRLPHRDTPLTLKPCPER